ncbi:MAG TPA: ABC transporter permease subunit/CPBP intramembrane protease [Pirellulales bacterium]|nr:ABC transporter permease subunit/CPBP intramembrane protease [Pirellulales bacterium]
MNWSNVKVVFLREVRDQLRDRRTLFMIAVLPVVLYPLLGMSMFQVTQFVREQTTKVLVAGADRLPASPALFEDGHFAERWFHVPDSHLDAVADEKQGIHHQARPANRHVLAVDFLPDDQLAKSDVEQREAWRAALDAGQYDAILYFPPEFAEQLRVLKETVHAERAQDVESIPIVKVPQPEVLFSTASEKSQVTLNRMERILGRWSEELGHENLTAGHIPENAATPFSLVTRDLADKGHRDAALWSKILPFLLLIWALTGAFYPAVDVCAGEKERGTLETLLSSPAERIEIVWGKLLTVMLFSMATSALNLLSMGITGTALLSQLPRFGPPPPLAPVWLLIALVPVSALFSALCMALASFARSTKEGQYYLMPLVLVTLPLVMLPMSPGVELTLGNSLIPVTGVVLLLRAMLEGNYGQAFVYGPPVIMATLACCLLAIRWAVEQFNSESVLFRESERLDIRLWFRQLMHDREDTPTVAGAVFCGVLILLIRFFMGFALPQPQNFAEMARLTLVTQLVVVATPALLMTIMLARSARQTLLLRVPAAATIPAAILLALAIYPIAGWLTVIVQQLYPLNPYLKDALAGLMTDRPELWKMLLVIAVTPAICEELAFRGFILSGLRHLGHKWRAIVISSLLFGITHAVFQQSIVAFLLGLVVGYIAVQTGSLLPGMFYHVTHNSLMVLTLAVTAESFEKYPALGYLMKNAPDGEGYLANGYTVIAAGLVAVVLLNWFRRLPYAKSAEESLEEAIKQHASQAPMA